MLELKHLTKVYRTKGGTETRALDDVSVSFAETGLVFLLGKSGSGKSTLLNLAGGLDEPTSGEVVVMGRSSRDFSGADFDSYRNTYVGFVFQEYNVLNEFNVEENVALALELQGKTREKEKVRQILEEVELERFAKRRPNTLSGGQKQRIAIARALVKDPQIIMADEPTGALDSATGKQVFDTLKKLSETRLVLVVSHDREFAEIYGDRIIELRDGKIISDVIKVKAEAQALSANVKQIDNDTLTVKSGTSDEEILNAVKKFLAEGEGELLISRGARDIESFRRVNHIDENGARERFDDTPPMTVSHTGDKAKFIRSKLPAGKAIKIGASGLKLKPFRLILTILLSVVSFVMFGLFSTMMLYDEQSVLVNSFMSSDYEYLTVNKQYEVKYTYSKESYSYTSYRGAQFTPAEVTKLGGNDAFGAYSARINSFRNVSYGIEKSDYYNLSISSVSVLPKGHSLRSRIQGQYPTKADEVCVSTYFLDCLKNAQFFPLNEKDEPSQTAKPINTASDLIGEKLSTYDKVYTITGVFDSGSIPAKFDELKTSSAHNNYILLWEFQSYITEGLHSLAFADESLIEDLESNGNYEEYVEYFDYCENEYSVSSPYTPDYRLYTSNSVKVYESSPAQPQLPVLRFDGSTAPLTDKQLIPSVHFIYYYFVERYWNEIEPEILKQEPLFEDYGEDEDAYWADWNEWDARHQEAYDKYYAFEMAGYALVNGSITDHETGEWHTPTREELEASIQVIADYVKESFHINLGRENWRNGTVNSLGEYEIVGFYYTFSDRYRYTQGYYCSQNFYDNAGVYAFQSDYTEETKYEPEADATFSYVFVPIEKTRDGLTKLFDKLFVTDPDTDVLYSTDNFLYSSILSVNNLVENLSLVFLIIGIVLAVFAALLLFNFITMSISNKKKEIGILRAVGARGIDVFKIFFSESGIIVGICTVLALIGSIVLTFVINNVLKVEAGLDVTLFVFGPLSVLLMVGIAFAVAVISTFLPVFFAARKKPVESLRAL